MKVEVCGSKWAGEKPDKVSSLFAMLAKEPLDPSFERYGNFFYRADNDRNLYHIDGNFLHISYVFRISGTKAELDKLRRACRANQKTSAYLEAKREEDERYAKRELLKGDFRP